MEIKLLPESVYQVIVHESNTEDIIIIIME